jgi:hypothetical protein
MNEFSLCEEGKGFEDEKDNDGGDDMRSMVS